MQIAFNEVGRLAIMSDPNWNGGDYYGGAGPDNGLAVARMIGHITYLSDESMHEKFGRRLRDKTALGYDFTMDFEVESYLRHQGEVFTRRFDANTYLYVTKALDYFDLAGERGLLEEVFRELPREMRFLVIAFSSDWLYPPYQSKEIVRALRGTGFDCTYLEMKSSFGHDAFLLENKDLTRMVASFLETTAETEGVAPCLGDSWRRPRACGATTSSSSIRCPKERGCSTWARARGRCSRCWSTARRCAAPASRSWRSASTRRSRRV